MLDQSSGSTRLPDKKNSIDEKHSFGNKWFCSLVLASKECQKMLPSLKPIALFNGFLMKNMFYDSLALLSLLPTMPSYISLKMQWKYFEWSEICEQVCANAPCFLYEEYMFSLVFFKCFSVPTGFWLPCQNVQGF